MNTALMEKAFENDVLDRGVHMPLVKDIENIARAAGIPISMVWTSMVDYCSEEEVEYVRQIRTASDHGLNGLAYTGKNPNPPVHKRMLVIAGTCLRNFMNAKVMTIREIVDALKNDQMPRPSVLLVPNFFDGEETSVPKWQAGMVLDMLYSRAGHGLQTFVYVRSLAEVKNVYGETLYRHLCDTYRMIEA